MDRVEIALREFVASEIPDSDVVPGLSVRDLLTEYGAWRFRYPAAVPRRCHVSQELVENPKIREVRAELDELQAAIEAGNDVGPYLSGRVGEGLDPERYAWPLPARRDRDLMLASWGIHHLHISPVLGDRLVFAAFQPADAYLIGLYGHRDFARRSVLEIAVRTWPNAGILVRTGSLGLSHSWSDRERKQLRQAGISDSMVEVEGTVWITSTLGQTMDGTPLVVANRVMALTWTLDDWRENLEQRLAEAEQTVDETLGRKANGDWEPAIHEGQVGIVRDACFHAIGQLP